MDRKLEQRLTRLANARERGLLRGGLKGLEKEGLRVAADGSIAQTPHPRALGAALTHPWITTDYSEALLELITPPLPDVRECVRRLCETHQFVYRNLGEEFVWAASMPCIVGGDDRIPIARYGSSNSGRMKHIYRVGLAWRYGKMMQVIAGTHFNYSLPEHFWPAFRELEEDRRALRAFRDESYFCLIRNLQRLGWLVFYLFGASPAVCKSFLAAADAGFSEYDRGTWYEPHATTLRMSDIGYRNKSPEELVVSYNSLADYVESLTRAIETPFPRYQEIGVVVGGEYRQLNANYLQIENEYYSSVRAKQLAQGYEKPTLALLRRGVRYVELRSVDLNVFEPCGADEDQLRFLEALLVLCLLMDSPPVDRAERAAIDYNQGEAAHRGRAPGLRLRRGEREIGLREWAAEVFAALAPVCELLDEGEDAAPYSAALGRLRGRVDDPGQTPSAQVLAAMRSHGESFFHFARRLSQQHRRYFMDLPVPAERFAELEALARRSHEDQQHREATETGPFEAFLADYFAQQP